MSSRLNLASRPFTNRILPWTIVAVVSLTSLVSLILIFRSTAEANSKAAVAQTDINNLMAQQKTLQRQEKEVKDSLSETQLRTLGAAHALVDRKIFSWSRLLADLEAALPGTVRVTRITVRDVAARGSETVAELELTVVAKSPSVITEMIGQMDRARIFETELRSQNLQKGRGDSGTQYELYVLYIQPVRQSPDKPSADASTSKEAELPAGGGEGTR